MDKIARLRQEIERRMKIYKESNYGISLRYQELEELLSFLDTLSEEPDKSLEEAANTYKNSYSDPNGALARASKRAFIAGWKCRDDQMLKEAINAYIVKSYNPCTENSERSLHGIELLYEDKNKPYLLAGDKVRIVVLKEEE